MCARTPSTPSTYELYFDDYYVLKTAHQERVRAYDSATLINVRDHGAKGDGTTDDTAAIKRTVSALNTTGGILYFPLGTYLVATTSNHESVMMVASDRHVEVDFMCSTLKLAPSGFPGYYLVNVSGCADAEVRDGIVVGDRIEHDYTAASGSHPYGMGIRSTHSARCAFLNMEAYDMTGDGAYVMNYGQGLTTISDCTLHHCRRQGLSISSADAVNVCDTEIYAIGDTDGITGTAPKYGIDVEPNSLDHGVRYALFSNVSVHDNTAGGIAQASPMRAAVYDVEVADSVVDRPYILNGFRFRDTAITFSGADAGSIGHSSLTGCHVSRTGSASKTGTLYPNDVRVDKCVFEGNDLASSNGVLSMRIMPQNNTIVTNTTFKNIQGKGNYASGAYADYGLPLVDISGSWGLAEGSGNNRYEGCSLMLDNFHDVGSTLINCQVYKRDKESVTITGNTFDGCAIRLMSNPITFVDCDFTGCAIAKAGGAAPTVTMRDSRLAFASIADKSAFPGAFARRPAGVGESD